jgi:hypothetical protein
MGQQEQGNDMTEPEPPARHGRLVPWLRRIAACALVLTIGLGQAYADELASGHESGQGRDKSSAFAAAEAFAGDGTARASSTARSAAFGEPRTKAAVQPQVEEAKVTVKVEEEGIGTDAWTRTVTRTKVNRHFVSSVTRSLSFAIDEEGNRAIARAVAKARAPNNVAAVRNGAGSVTAKTSVDVTGNGIASADAGGSIGVGGRGVKVETWGRTSAEVF